MMFELAVPFGIAIGVLTLILVHEAQEKARMRKADALARSRADIIPPLRKS